MPSRPYSWAIVFACSDLPWCYQKDWQNTLISASSNSDPTQDGSVVGIAWKYRWTNLAATCSKVYSWEKTDDLKHGKKNRGESFSEKLGNSTMPVYTGQFGDPPTYPVQDVCSGKVKKTLRFSLAVTPSIRGKLCQNTGWWQAKGIGSYELHTRKIWFDFVFSKIVRKKTLKRGDDYTLQKSRTRNPGEGRKLDFQNYHVMLCYVI